MSTVSAIKPIISNAVADAIEGFRADGWSNARLLAVLTSDKHAVTQRMITTKTFYAGAPDTLLAALVNGYEREQTAEEIANGDIKREYLQRLCDAKSAKDRGYGAVSIRENAFADGIRFAVDTLGVKISEVNV